MSSGNVRNSRRFIELASLLRSQAQHHGVTLMEGEAEQILGDRLTAVSSQFRVTERTALASYLSEDAISLLARTLGSMAGDYREATRSAEPVTIDVADAGRITAAAGMVIKLAITHLARTKAESTGITADSADVLVRLGAEIRAARSQGQVRLGGHDLVLARSVLVQAIDLLRSEQWPCPCGPHPPGAACRLVATLTADLGIVGGWPNPAP